MTGRPDQPPNTRRTIGIYVAVVAASIAVVVILLQVGTGLLQDVSGAAPATRPDVNPLREMAANAAHPIARLLLQLLVIIFAARVAGRIAAAMGQPPVIGEIAAGLILGPSIVGALMPGVTAFLFAPASLPALQLLSQIGVLLFMFTVGVEFDLAHVRGHTRTAVAVSHFSIAVPFILGVLLAITMYRGYAPAGVPFTAFALFLGIAMSITAFPVLARILDDRKLTGTPLGTTALTCAAIGDVVAWSLLAFVSAISRSQDAAVTLLAMLATTAGFIAVMLFGVRPILSRVLDARNGFGKSQLGVVLLVMVGSALMTESIGIHGLFGAFLAGVIMPADAAFRQFIRERVETISMVLLLPLFFAYTGLRTEVGLLNSAADWAVCLAVILVATAGKMGGTIAAARWTGVPWHESMVLGALMNTRGLMELIALNVGYDLGILPPKIFTIMVLMALVTTCMTGPLLTLASSRRAPERQRAAGARAPE